jgi:hypothetical protein
MYLFWSLKMALIVNTNSWVDVIDADDYLSDKFGASTWVTLTDPQKSQLLITAFRWIYNYPYYAIPQDISDMEAIRKEKIQSAQIELANWYYNYGLTHEQRMALQSDGVTEFTLSKWKETFDKKLNDLPQIVKEILIDEYTHAGGYILNVKREKIM